MSGTSPKNSLDEKKSDEGLKESLGSLLKRVYNKGKSVLAGNLRKLFLPIWNTITSRWPLGTNIFDRDWDLLIVLDACRADMAPKIAKSLPEYNKSGKTWSVGSMTGEWTLKTFDKNYKDKVARTAHITSAIWSHNVFSNRLQGGKNHKHNFIHKGFPDWDPVSEEEFKHFELVHPIANHTDKLHPDGGMAHIVTDRAISVGRNQDFERMIVHYAPPHLKFISNALDWNPDDPSMDNLMSGPEPIRELYPHEEGYKPLRKAEVSLEKVRKSYEANLKLVLAYVNILLENIDAEKVVITADHGEAFGEYGVWGHPVGWPLPPVKTVPWVTTTATDKKTYQPKHEQLEKSPDKQQIREHLKNLGYLT